MNYKRFLLIVSALAAAFVSCSRFKEIDAGEASPFDIRLEYTVIESAIEITDVTTDETATKQTLSGVKYETNWDASDAVALYNATKGELNRYVVKSGAGTSSAVFTPDGAVPSYASSDELYIIYPYEAASLEDGKLYLSIYRDAEEDSYSLSSNKVFSRNDLLMSKRFKRSSLSEGNLDIGRLTLYRLVALVNLTTGVSHDDLFNEPIGEVRFKCKGVAGKSAVTFTNGVPSLAANGGSEDECVFLTHDAPKMASKDYLARFVPIFPVNMSQDSNNGFSFILVGDEHEAGFHRALSYTMRGNANVNYFLINGVFGMTPVASESAATTDFSWWWAEKPDLPLAPSDLENHNLYYGEANCVVIPAGQLSATLDVSLYKAGDDHARGAVATDYVTAARSAAVIWREPGLIFNKVSLSNRHKTLNIELAANSGGNALVGIYDKYNNLLWSFHVWAPVAFEDGTANGFTANHFALGQITSATDTYLCYQWGRKDPLGRAPNYDVEQPNELFSMQAGNAPNAKTPSLIENEGIILGPVSLDVARQNPTVFYGHSNTFPIDWSSPADDNLWNDTYKTIYDPCPKGYRIPSNELWRGITQGSSATPSIATRGNLVYTTAGRRAGVSGLYYDVGKYGEYWTGTAKPTSYAADLRFSSQSASSNFLSVRGDAHGIRCILE